jgi:hypothetical protein
LLINFKENFLISQSCAQISSDFDFCEKLYQKAIAKKVPFSKVFFFIFKEYKKSIHKLDGIKIDISQKKEFVVNPVAHISDGIALP